MIERPILFSGPMVRAILEGRKTKTRRVADLADNVRVCNGVAKGFLPGAPDGFLIRCRYGKPGDRLRVRETWQPIYAAGYNHKTADWETGQGYAPSYPATDGIQEFQNPDDELTDRCWPSIHMKRWASRITLEIVSIKVERVQDISEADAKSEGCLPADHATGRECILEPSKGSYRLHFQSLWDSINSDRGYGWGKNPWVWVIEFKRVEASR